MRPTFKQQAEWFQRRRDGDMTQEEVELGIEVHPRTAEECEICCDRVRNCRLRPCNHALLCNVCAEAIKEAKGTCPYCDAGIESIDPIDTSIYQASYYAPIRTCNDASDM